VSQLASNVRLAILDAVAKIPGAVLGGNWKGLAAAVRARVYAEVAERLLQGDRGTVAAALLAILQGGQIDRDACTQILLAWAGDRVKDSDKLSFLAGGLEDGRLTREEVIAAVAAWARTQVDDEVALSLLKTLEDGQLDAGKLKEALLAAAADLAGDSEVAAALRDALADGRLGRDEAVQVIVAWGQRQIRDETLRALFTALAGIVSTGSDRPRARDVLARVLQASGLDAGTVQAVLAAVEDGRLDPAELLLVLATWSAAAGGDLGGLAGQIGGGDPLAAAEALLQRGLPQDAQTLLQKVLAEDWLGVLSAVLGTLELGLGGRLLRQLVGGRFRDQALRELTRLLEKTGLEQSGTIASVILDIAVGVRSLFAEGEEADSGLKKPADIALFREVRQVLFMAQLATFGGPLVPTGAQDRPHLFAAASIRFRTPIHDLVPEDTGEDTKKLFCNTVTAFLDRHFGARMRRRFLEEPVLAIDLNDLRPEDPSTVRAVFVKVQMRLAPSA
jgi:hypothetical protein